jgi:hypothetical protein
MTDTSAVRQRVEVLSCSVTCLAVLDARMSHRAGYMFLCGAWDCSGSMAMHVQHIPGGSICGGFAVLPGMLA